MSVKEPNIIVSTPVALLNYLYAIDPEKRRRTDFIRGVKYVVIFYSSDYVLQFSVVNLSSLSDLVFYLNILLGF